MNKQNPRALPWTRQGGDPPGPAILFLLLLLMLPCPAYSFTVAGEPAKANCRSCHGWRTPVTETRSLGAPHAGLRLRHGRANLWCLDCHLPDQPEMLKSTSAALPFAQAHTACATCHGRTQIAWQEGIHGKRVGSWTGERLILACTGCHNPHNPTIRPLVPQPPPVRGRGTKP
ncbi:MAG: cytochrome c3 family protein [Magnetococcus sp. YQC-3]